MGCCGEHAACSKAAVPEGVITDWIQDKALQFAANYILSQITSTRVKEALLSVLSRLIVTAEATETDIDDFLLKKVYKEFNDNWDDWFNYIRIKLGLIQIAESSEDEPSEEPIFVTPAEYPVLAPEGAADEFIEQKAEALAIPIATLFQLVVTLYPVLIKLFSK